MASYNEKSLIQSVLNSDDTVKSVATKTIDSGQHNAGANVIPDISYINKVVETNRNKQEMLEDITTLFPEIELAKRILISSITSPGDMVTVDFFCKTSGLNLPSTVVSQINEVIKTALVNQYDFAGLLSTMPTEVMFTHGSYTRVVIPENVLDSFINNPSISSEDISKEIDRLSGLGDKPILGSGTTQTNDKVVTSTESYHTSAKIGKKITIRDSDSRIVDLGVEVVDNISILQVADLSKEKNSLSVEERISGKTAKKIDFDVNILYTRNDDNRGTITNFRQLPNRTEVNRASITRPLNIKIPSTSIIPVHAPGDPSNQIGIFIPLDEQGMPITKLIKGDDLNSRLGDQLQASSLRILAKARRTVTGVASKQFNENKKIIEFYKNVIEKDLKTRIKNGIYNSNLDIGNVDDVYATLLYRHLSKENTRLLYVPKEYYTYFAWKTYDNGIGKALTDDLVIISSIRAMLLFTRLTAMVRNSIPSTLVTATIPESIEDPDKLVEKIVTQVLNSAGMRSVVGILKVNDLSEWVSRLGYEFAFKGHPALEGTALEYERKESNLTIPEDNLEEDLRKRSAMVFGLTPEQLDSSLSPEFATSLVINNGLFTKYIAEIHKVFNPLLTDFSKKVIKYDAVVRNSIKDILVANSKPIKAHLKHNTNINLRFDDNSTLETIVDAVVSKISITLPVANNVSLDTLSEQYDDYDKAVDTALENVINEYILDSDITGDVNNSVDSIKAVYKSYLMRNWMANNNYLPEMLDIINTTADGKPNINLETVMTEHSKALMNSVADYIKSLSKTKKKIDNKLNSDDETENDNNTDNTNSGDENKTGGDENNPGF